MKRAAIALLLTCTSLSVVQAQPAPSPMPEPPPPSPAATSATVIPSAPPPPTSPPSATPSPTIPTPAPTPTILMLPPDATPQILYVAFSSLSPKVGETVTETVLTSSNVASVEIRIGGYGWSLPKTGVGRFEGSYVVPRLPFFMSHSLTLQIIARNTAGVAASTSVAMHVR